MAEGYYNLKAIIAVGYKLNSPRAVQFRKWANDVIEEFTIKGFTMDDEQLKNFGTVLTKDYFEEQLQRVREIRLSERSFYQKIITSGVPKEKEYDKKYQNGIKFRSLCDNCNNDLLGVNYDKVLAEFTSQIMQIVKSSIALPPVFKVTVKINRLCRAACGHFKENIKQIRKR